MPRLWTETVESHRRAVRDAALDAAAALVARHGLRGVTMSQIAEDAGIGRATLYKYFPDVDAVLIAWHERQVSAHLDQLVAARDNADHADDAHGRLTAVLAAYARIAGEPHGHHDAELTVALHTDTHVAQAHDQLRRLLHDVLSDAATAGHVRDDVPIDELAGYCLHALSAARNLPSEAAVERLVTLTLTGLRPHWPRDMPRAARAAAGSSDRCDT